MQKAGLVSDREEISVNGGVLSAAAAVADITNARIWAEQRYALLLAHTIEVATSYS